MLFSLAQVLEIQAATGCGKLDCNNALRSTNGDKAKAIALLKETHPTRHEKEGVQRDED